MPWSPGRGVRVNEGRGPSAFAAVVSPANRWGPDRRGRRRSQDHHQLDILCGNQRSRDQAGGRTGLATPGEPCSCPSLMPSPSPPPLQSSPFPPSDLSILPGTEGCPPLSCLRGFLPVCLAPRIHSVGNGPASCLRCVRCLGFCPPSPPPPIHHPLTERRPVH
jgi:hypothetical protein